MARLPDMVTTGSDGVKRVKYDDLIPLIIEAFKAEATAKDAEIAALKSRVERAEQDSAQLKRDLCAKFSDLTSCQLATP